MPSDAQRVDRLRMLVDHGKLDQILTSHDIHTKHRLVSNNTFMIQRNSANINFNFKTEFGGHGFGHLLNNVKPKMLLKGFTEDQINTIMVKNPANWLQF